jgi:hypothetical protein
MVSKNYLARRAAYHDAEFIRVLKETSELHNRLQEETDEIHRLETVEMRVSADLKLVQRLQVAKEIVRIVHVEV